MHVVPTNFAKTLVWKREYDVKLWRHKQRTPNTNDYHMPLNETPPMKIFCVRHCSRRLLRMCCFVGQAFFIRIHHWFNWLVVQRNETVRWVRSIGLASRWCVIRVCLSVYGWLLRTFEVGVRSNSTQEIIRFSHGFRKQATYLQSSQL